MVFLPKLMPQMGIPNQLFNKHLNHLKPIACIPGFKHRLLFKLWVDAGQEGFFFRQFLIADLPPPISGMAFVSTIPTVSLLGAVHIWWLLNRHLNYAEQFSVVPQ